MPSKNDVRFGKLVLAQKMCTSAQIEECLREQAKRRPEPALDQVMLDKGVLTPEQHAQAAELLRKISSQVMSSVPMPKQTETRLIGQIAVQKGMLTQAEMDECIAQKSVENEARSMGEVMVEKGFLTKEQVGELLSDQQKRIMNCPACKLTFTVTSTTGMKAIECPRCKGPLAVSRPDAPIRIVGEIKTQYMRAVPQKPSAPVAPAAGAKKQKLRCVICDTKFEGEKDVTGRVRCPGCHTTFLPR